MQCEEARERIGALIDGELTGDPRRELDAHVEACDRCSQEVADLKRLRRQLTAVRASAPPALAGRVRGALAAEATRDEAKPRTGGSVVLPIGGPRGGARIPLRQRLRPLMRLAAVILVSCGLSAGATWYAVHGVDDRAAVECDVLSAHVRSLLQDNPVQIASADTHTVKPWFAGRIEFSPVVTDPAAEGFPLAGGRLDYTGGHRVAALVYRRRLHLVTVFMWPCKVAAEARPSSMRVRLQSYHLEQGRHDLLGRVRPQRRRVARAADAVVSRPMREL